MKIVPVGETLTIFDAMKMMFNVRSISLGVKAALYERVVVPTVTFGAEMWGMRMDDTLAGCFGNKAFAENVRSKMDLAMDEQGNEAQIRCDKNN